MVNTKNCAKILNFIQIKYYIGYYIYRENNSRILVMMPNLTKTGIITYGSDMTGMYQSYSYHTH